MKILVTGGTGFVGQQLVKELGNRGYEVVVLSRDPEKAVTRLPINCEVHGWEPTMYSPSHKVFKDVDAVIHLAGENIASGRWTEARKRSIRDSRVLSTRNLVRAMATLHPKPLALVSASAIGFYGEGGDRELNEDLPSGKGFLAEVCRDWETEVFKAEDVGVRSVALRLGVVLGHDGGAMSRMLPPFRLGAGGRLGGGSQWMSWIHIHDLINMMIHAIENPTLRGPYNAVSPNPVTNQEFTETLARVLDMPAILPVPAFGLKVLLGEMADMLLGSQKVSAEKIANSGFEFTYGNLEDALKEVCSHSAHELQMEQWIPLPMDKTFSFFRDTRNLEKITPEFLHFKVLNQSTEEVEEGTKINYCLRLHGIPMWWQSKITDWQPNRKFSDTQTHGPYNHWYHTHEFEEKNGGTIIRDRISYRVPFGVPGDLIASNMVRKDVERIFAYRRNKINEIFLAGKNNN